MGIKDRLISGFRSLVGAYTLSDKEVEEVWNVGKSAAGALVLCIATAFALDYSGLGKKWFPEERTRIVNGPSPTQEQLRDAKRYEARLRSSAEGPDPFLERDYIVQKGDTLCSIARQQGMTLRTLVEYNSTVDPNKIKIGQRIILPPAAIAQYASR